ncbi:DNA gyrase inhibitor YacG [Sphingomonas abaci]|uniref:DNA gyrase inhibitor YacG n=1 Tax=Sphingomonas abaci TaxID=237611 RepID=A0A7W7EWN5_9SPHN|nr:DNA gyrase inhibitor YacG [Sphingomonas abaci]MBB4616249.1 hypothetical protein [Sphingomonas abaci]
MAEPACPICSEPAHLDHRPFCSARHRDRDLLQWLNESYRLPDQNSSKEGLDSADGSY